MQNEPEQKNNQTNHQNDGQPDDVVIVHPQFLLDWVENQNREREDTAALIERAEAGDTNAQYEAGARCVNGIGVRRDMAEAVKWFQAAADGGDARALETLGRCYQFGAGVKPDEAHAVELYRQSAEMEYPPAQCSLALCLMAGTGVEKNTDEGVELMTKAAEQGFPQAAYHLGMWYHHGIVVQPDKKKSIRYLTEAAEEAYPAAMSALGTSAGVAAVPGLIGAAVGFSLQWLLYAAVTRGIANSDTMQLLRVVDFRQIWGPVAAVFAGVGILVGVGGSLTAIRKFLRV